MKQLAVGKPFRATRIRPLTSRGQDWLILLKNIPKGYAQEVSVHHSSARDAIGRLEKTEAITKGAYMVRSAQGKVYVIHSDRTQAEAAGRRATDKEAIEINDDDVEEYLASKTNFEHTLNEIQKHFFGRILHSRKEPLSYGRLYDATTRVRRKIEREQGGKFVAERRLDGSNIYRLEKKQS